MNSDVVETLILSLSNSATFQQQIKADYGKFSSSITSGVTFFSGDLHCAIDKVSYTAETEEKDGKLIVRGVLSDTYDFTEIGTHDSGFSWLSVEVNNLGYRL